VILQYRITAKGKILLSRLKIRPKIGEIGGGGKYPNKKRKKLEVIKNKLCVFLISFVEIQVFLFLRVSHYK